MFECIDGALNGMKIGLFTGGISVNAENQIQLRAMITSMLWLNVTFILSSHLI